MRFSSELETGVGGTLNVHTLQWNDLVLETNPNQPYVAYTGDLGCHPNVLAAVSVYY